MLFWRCPFPAASLTIELSWSLILLLALVIARRTDFRPELASSAINSGERIQRLISLLIGDIGSRKEKRSDKLSGSNSSERFWKKLLTRRVTSKQRLTSNSSPIPKIPPTCNLMTEGRMSVSPEKERRPDCKILERASAVSCCQVLIFARWEEGFNLRQRSFAIGEAAKSSNFWMILSNSKVWSAFSFILLSYLSINTMRYDIDLGCRELLPAYHIFWESESKNCRKRRKTRINPWETVYKMV